MSLRRHAITEPLDIEATVERRVLQLASFVLKRRCRVEYGRDGIARLLAPGRDKILAVIPAHVAREAEAVLAAFDPDEYAPPAQRASSSPHPASP